MINELKNKEILEESLKENSAVLLYFYNDDCPPCVALRPKVQNFIDNEFPRMKVVFINAKVFPELAASYGVFASPTIIIFFDGKENKRFSKYISLDEMADSIGRAYNILFD